MLSQSVKCLIQNYQNSTQIKRMKTHEASSLNNKAQLFVLYFAILRPQKEISWLLSQFPFPVHSVPLPLSPSHSIQMNVCSDNRVIISASNKCFGLVDMYQRALERNIAVGRDENAINHSQDFFPCAQYNEWFETPSDPQWQWWEMFSLHDIQSTLAHGTFNWRCRRDMLSWYKGHFIWSKGNPYVWSRSLMSQPHV